MKTTVQIQNLKCNGCASTINNKLTGIKNIDEVSIDVETGSVSFEYDSEETLETVKKELHKIGYPLVGEDNSLPTKAKSYVSCAIGKMNN